MKISKINNSTLVSDQLTPNDIDLLAKEGIKTIVCNRPDGEGSDQPNFNEIESIAKQKKIECHYLPITTGKISDANVSEFSSLLEKCQGPILAYCRTGTRAITLWALANSQKLSITEILSIGKKTGYDLSGIINKLTSGNGKMEPSTSSHRIVIVGAGAAGAAVASSLISRVPDLDIAIIDPADTHYYQPGWTMVGAGVFKPEKTVKTMASIIPNGVKWIKSAVAAFEPNENKIVLEGCRVINYEKLIICPGLKLNWNEIEGLTQTLGSNGVTSNYRYDLAPYTWELVQGLKNGKALFTQPPMPIKCAGAPQKAMYMSGSHWYKSNDLKNIDIEFYNAGAVLFGVKEYVPALMKYIKKYNVDIHFGHKLIKVDGPNKKAWFSKTDTNGNTVITETNFDMLHVVPPQQAPDFIRASNLVNDDGWLDVNPDTLQHKTYPHIYGLGDVTNSPNAKTAAAARKQAPVVATNLLFDLGLGTNRAAYDGYGSCPLTVERGKIVLAEFGYGGRLLPTFPKWLVDGTQPSRLAWILKELILPPIYWKAMLKGREWLAKPISLQSEK
jgi:sulfide:quinone oxidoreductase